MKSAASTVSPPVISLEKLPKSQENTGSTADPGATSEPEAPLLRAPPRDDDHAHEEPGCACLNCSGNGACGRRENQRD